MTVRDDQEAETLSVVEEAQGEQNALIDDIGTRYGAGAFDDEIRAARKDFDALRGRVFDDDTIYPTHMAFFLEWYVIERALTGREASPLVAALEAGEVADARRPLAEALAHSHRALFEVLRAEERGLRLYDFVGDCFWWAHLGRPWVGVVRGEIFEGRLIPWEGGVRLGPHVFYHPREAHDAIRCLVEARSAAGRLDTSLPFDLAEMRLRESRFRNIAIDQIYRDR
ncbi:MAG: hypothetical protein KAI47_26235 [Deltaproteobacteria bacterium]|nr:hypothetical protein [Deltaproteobacteria bacterium]